MNEGISLEVATLAGGCFWCIEAVFREIDGVENVVSGYAGGSTTDPTYQQVCTGKTGHAEAIQVSFNPAQISYREILHIFFFCFLKLSCYIINICNTTMSMAC